MVVHPFARIVAPLLFWIVLIQGTLAQQATTLRGPHYELSLDPKATILSRFDNGWETKMVVEYEGQKVRISWKDDLALILFPTSTLRLKVEESMSGSQTVTANLDADRYLVKKNPREVAWILPGQEVYFKTRGGQVSQVVGTNDYLKIWRDTRSGRMTLQSNAGQTDALINGKGTLEAFDGPQPTEHLYLVRGLAFRQGPVTVRLRLPESPFLKALPADRFLTIEKELVGLPEPAAQAAPENKVDPLQAEPATWDSPQLRAKFNEPGTDPLSVKKETRLKNDGDPLKAKSAPDSEEILRVKDY